MKNVFKSVFNFVLSQRRSGTTTLLKKIAEENDVWVVVANATDALQFKQGSCVSVYHLADMKCEGLENRPILMDNRTLSKLMEAAARQEEKISAMEEVVAKFTKDIAVVMKMDCEF